MDAPLPPRGFHRLVTSLGGFLLPNPGLQTPQFLRSLPLPRARILCAIGGHIRNDQAAVATSLVAQQQVRADFNFGSCGPLDQREGDRLPFWSEA
jgi:hypothetical protein